MKTFNALKFLSLVSLLYVTGFTACSGGNSFVKQQGDAHGVSGDKPEEPKYTANLLNSKVVCSISKISDQYKKLYCQVEVTENGETHIATDLAPGTVFAWKTTVLADTQAPSCQAGANSLSYACTFISDEEAYAITIEIAVTDEQNVTPLVQKQEMVVEAVAPSQIVNPPVTAVAYYAFAPGSHLVDGSGNGHTLTDHGGVSFVTGTSGDAANFFGGNYLTTNNLIIDITKDFTVAVRGRATVLAASQRTYAAYISLADIFGIWAASPLNGGFTEEMGVHTSGGWSGMHYAQDLNYHELVMVVSSNNFTTYRDGVLVGTNFITHPLSNNQHPSVIGIGGNSDGYNLCALNGQVDAVGVYDRAMTTDEVQNAFYFKPKN